MTPEYAQKLAKLASSLQHVLESDFKLDGEDRLGFVLLFLPMGKEVAPGELRIVSNNPHPDRIMNLLAQIVAESREGFEHVAMVMEEGGVVKKEDMN